MKCVDIEDLLASKKYVIKENPMYKLWKEGRLKSLRKAPKKCILVKTPPWAKAWGGKIPESIKGVNMISAYIWSKMKNIAPDYRFEITRYIWNKLEENDWAKIKSFANADVSQIKSELDTLYNEALEYVSRVYNIPVEAIKTSGETSRLRRAEQAERSKYFRAIAEKRLVPVR